MDTKKRRIIVGVTTLVVLAGAAGGAYAASTGEDDVVIGPDADRASAAALAATGGGTANSVERDNEDGAVWEVEVTGTDGTTVDVRLDEALEVVVIENDSESPDTDDPDE